MQQVTFPDATMAATAVDGSDARFRHSATACDFAQQFKSALLGAEIMKHSPQYHELKGVRCGIESPVLVYNPSFDVCEVQYIVRDPSGEVLTHAFARALTSLSFDLMSEAQTAAHMKVYGDDMQPSPDHDFKNFHRLLCERFGYTHDEVNWKRDQLSLIEWIDKSKQSVEQQRDDLFKVMRLIAAQSVGDDWTIEEAYVFIKQQAAEARNAMRVEMGVRQST